MQPVKITVVKKSLYPELAEQYVGMPVETCPVYTEGQEFIISGLMIKPEGFCEWAWNDIYKTVVALARGGNFSRDTFEGWMKDDRTMITCCTDGIRPVIFKVERVNA